MKFHGDKSILSRDIVVIVITYNQAQFIEETLDSILCQDRTYPFSILVHDDASTDGTIEKLLNYQVRNPNDICLILQDSNTLSLGMSPFLSALPLIDSKYVAICEGDDFWKYPRKLFVQYNFMEEFPNVSISHHEAAIVNSNGSETYKNQLENYLAATPRKSEFLQGASLVEGNFILTSTVLIRTSRISLPSLRRAEGYMPFDWIIFSQVSENSEIGFIDKTMAVYRLHSSNLWATVSEETRATKGEDARWIMAGVLSGDFRSQMRKSLSNQAELGQKQAELGQKREEIEILRLRMKEMEAISAQYSSVIGSRSWRYTAFLRFFFRLLRFYE